MVGKSRESRARFRGELGHVRIEEIRVRRDVGSAHPPADLVQLREAELVGPLDDERVGLRDVEAGLDDRRRDEHVRVAAQERVHLLLQLALAHLPVRDEETEVRRELLQLLRRLLDRLDAVVEVEGLPLALDLALERELDSSSSYSPTVVRIGRRPSGGVSMIEMSRSPESDMCSVRGIGVALSVSTSTSRRSDRSSSFCATPKRCSSSRMTSPSSFGITSRLRIRCVPIRTSTFPAWKSASTCFTSRGGRNRDTISTRTGKSR